jgi:hypothetical protein
MPQSYWPLIYMSLAAFSLSSLTKVCSKWTDRQIKRQSKRQLAERASILSEIYPKYKYKPLGNPEAKNIRLIELQPHAATVEAAGPVIKIRTSSLRASEIEPYEALSYCWGEAIELVPIICDEGESCVVFVTENLYGALVRLSKSLKTTRLLWIDAISIDQQDLAKKS